MEIVGILVAIVAVIFVVLFVVGRMSGAGREQRMRDAITTYVTTRGGTITWDGNGGAQITGPRGSGYESFVVMRMTWKEPADDNWIGFGLRKYMPDPIEESFARQAEERLAKLLPTIAALSPDEVRGKLRARIVGSRDTSKGLSTLALTLGTRHELRVVLDGFDVAGVPESVRAKLDESDEALRDRAIDQTVGDETVDRAAGSAKSEAWLARASRLFGDAVYVIAPDENGLSWKSIGPAAEAELCALASRSLGSKRMKGVMFVWDGSALHGIGVVTHSIMGPNTPDYTLTMEEPAATALGVSLVRGAVGVRRAGR